MQVAFSVSWLVRIQLTTNSYDCSSEREGGTTDNPRFEIVLADWTYVGSSPNRILLAWQMYLLVTGRSGK